MKRRRPLGPKRKITELIRASSDVYGTAWVRFECGHEGPTWAGRSSPMPGAYGHCLKCIPVQEAAR